MEGGTAPSPGLRGARAVLRPEKILWVGLLLFLLLFVLFPLFSVFREASPSAWRSVLSGSRWKQSLRNTLLLSCLSTLFSIITGFIFAYACIRGGIPLGGLFSFVPILHLVTPPFVGGLSFILLFGRQGFLTHSLLGLDVSLYGLPGLLIAQTLCFFPMAFLIIKGALEGMNSSLEYAALNLGAGKLQVFLSVTLPLCAQGILQAALFIAISVLSDFGNPMLIGGRYQVLAVELYTQLTGWANAGSSAVLGIILLLPALLLFIAQRSLFRRKGRDTATVGSRSGKLPLPLPSLAVRVFLFSFCALISLIVFLQFFAIILGALSTVWGVNPEPTLKHLINSLSYREELRNTLVFSFLAALSTALMASLLSFCVYRLDMPLRSSADFSAMISAALPGSLIGLAFVVAFNGPPFFLAGKAFLIVIAMIVCTLPAAYRIVSASLLRIRSSLDDSARSLGASPLRMFRTVIEPLIRQGILGAFIYTFVRCAGTLSAVIFLISFNTKLCSVLILNLANQGDWGGSAALALLLTLIVFLSLGLLRLLLGRGSLEDVLG